ncbi:MAG: hypothetical protein QOC92_1393 [Acidimicrobiaceae bacterium]|jgi:hypothetical protein
MKFVPYTALVGEPNVIVDGAATTATVLTLSHWPGSTVPAPLRADLSAEIAVRYLERPDERVDADLVSNNHFDEDGLLGLYALVFPDDALARRELVIDVARAGDFAWSHTRQAARVAFALSSFVDPAVSPLDAAVFQGEYQEVAARLYGELLPRTTELLTNPDRFRDLWADEDAHLTMSNAMLDDGEATIVERPELDLAIVTVPPTLRERVVHRFTQTRDAGLHPMAVHNRTEMSRVAYVSGHHYEVQQRYETWVQLVSRRPLPRQDLGVLAERLNHLEADGGKWQFDGADYITPRLALRDATESSIGPTQFVAELLTFLPDAPSAWDPWAPRNA